MDVFGMCPQGQRGLLRFGIILLLATGEFINWGWGAV